MVSQIADPVLSEAGGEIEFSTQVPAASATDTLSMHERSALLRRYGDFTLAYSACHQEGISHFGDADGWIAYAERLGYTFVLGDPMTSDDNRESLIRRFVSSYPNSSFIQVGHQTAAVLNRIGYRINAMGVDTLIDLDEFSFRGKRKERYRYAYNWLCTHGFRCFESTISEVRRPRLKRLSLAWRKTRPIRKREVCFLNRPMVFRDEVDTRLFFLTDSTNQLFAFIGLDPLYRDGKVIGYVTTFKRRDPAGPSYSEQGLMKFVIDQLKEERRQELHLGLSPLAQIAPHEFRGNSSMGLVWSYAFNASWINRHFYNLQGHAAYKRRFRGEEIQTYFATKGFFNYGRIFALLRLCGVI